MLTSSTIAFIKADDIKLQQEMFHFPVAKEERYN